MNLIALAGCLQTLLTSRADELAEITQFIQRQNKLSGSEFLRTLMSVWFRRPSASLEALALPLGIAKQSLFDRFTPQATAFCRAVLFEGVQSCFAAAPETLPLLKPFQGVYLDDCTQLPLPDACAAEFAGCGSGLGDLGQAGMKVFTRFELQGGCIRHLSIHPARFADAHAEAGAPDLPKGSLHLADLGFIDFERLQRHTEQGVYFISRLPAQTAVALPGGPRRPLTQWLAQWREQGQTPIDAVDVQVGDKQTATGRLTVLACPATVVEERLRKAQANAQRRGRQLSARQREMCHWQVLFTNVPTAWLATEQVWQVYRLRWQIELLFKRFKSHGGMQRSTSAQPERVKCEWYVKLLIQLVKNGLMLLRGGPLTGVNQVLLGQLIQEEATKVFEAIQRGVQALRKVLRHLQKLLHQLRKRTRRRAHPTASEWFANAAPPP